MSCPNIKLTLEIRPTYGTIATVSAALFKPTVSDVIV